MDCRAFVPGYNNLIRAGNLGEGLRQAGDVLQPVFDTTRMMTNGNRRYQSGSGTNAPSGGISITGPAVAPAGSAQLKEVWWIRALGLRLASGASGTALGAHLAYGTLGGTEFMPISESVDIPINSQRALIIGIPDMILMPGDFIAFLPGPTNANVDYRWGILYDVLVGAP